MADADTEGAAAAAAVVVAVGAPAPAPLFKTARVEPEVDAHANGAMADVDIEGAAAAAVAAVGAPAPAPLFKAARSAMPAPVRLHQRRQRRHPRCGYQPRHHRGERGDLGFNGFGV